ncbi:rRNA maturation RNase YbeY [Candidatus Phytoplasma palmae]|uniref:rRNA maturation RNase YbeY n=1 Tax=Candidatus Phytoplasma palmae TaxID=85624 RepID=UPI0039906FA5
MIIYIYNQTKMNIFKLKKKIIKIFDSLEDEKKINIIFVNNKKIKEMNFYYLKKKYATDVLSFENEMDNIFLGDVFVSLEKALEQSLYYGHSFEREVIFLALHGYLHLKGYNDNDKESSEKMNSLQEKILYNFENKKK